MQIQSVFTNSSGTIFISGQATGGSGCTTGISLEVNCGGVKYNGSGTQTPGTNLWQGSVSAPCPCDSGPVTVTATCIGDPACTQTITINNLCCCPTFTNYSQTPGACVGSSQPFTFTVTVDNSSSSCALHVQRDFGDGNFGPVYTVPGYGILVITDTHSYVAPGTYVTHLNITFGSGNAPTGCPDPNQSQITAFCGTPPPPCGPTSSLFALCQALRSLFVIFAAIVAVYWNLLPCGTSISYAFYAALALIFGILFFVFCNKCYCKIALRISAELLIVVGILFMLFVPFLLCPPVNGATAAMVSGALILAGIGLLLIWRNQCNVSWCDFWCILGGLNSSKPSCTTNAVFAAVLLFLSTLVPGILVWGLLVTIATAATISTISCWVRQNLLGCGSPCSNC